MMVKPRNALLMSQMATVLAAFMIAIGGCSSTAGGISPTTTPKKTTILPTTRPEIPPGSPTVIYYNGNILTMDDGNPQVQAIALAGDMILALGSDEDILALQVPGTLTIDLQGRTLMPGFVDTHSHLLDSARNNPDTGTLEKAQELALQNGITTLGSMYTTVDFLEEIRSFEEAGQLQVRTSLYMVYVNACGVVESDWFRQYPATYQPGEMLRIGGVKIFTDGGSCGYPALSFERATGGMGDLWFTQEQLDAIVANIDQAGYQVAIHAVGDRAVDQALNAIEFTLAGKPNTLRHRIEHNATVSPEAYPRYQEIGAVASLWGNIWSCNDVFHHVGIDPDPPENQAWNFPYRAMWDASPEAHFAWQTDYPWNSINPLFHMYSLVTPRDIGGDGSECPDPEWFGNRTLTLDEVLPMMTIEGAYALFREQEVGSLVPGKYADLIILSGNPASDLTAIKDLKVWMTMVGGQVGWCAAGHEDLCPSDIPVKKSTLPPAGTSTTEPTVTATLAPTSTPEGLIFRDDFSGSLMEGWAWENENPARWSFTPEGWLQILGEDISLLANDTQNNLLCRAAPAGDYQVTIHVFADTFADFQQATLYVYQDGNSYVALNRGHCGPCLPGGSGVFMEYKMAGSWGSYKVATDNDDVFIRLVVQGSSITGYYALEPEAWERFGSVGNFIKDPNICLGVTNADLAGLDADLVGRFDYIDISLP